MKVESNESSSRSLRRMAVFVALMLPLVTALGFWQLDRAAYKQSLMDAYFEKLGGLPERISEADIPEAFTRVKLRGRYSETNLLLDNQVNQGRQGYWVYTPFTAAGTTWLINRGWQSVPFGPTKLRALPNVAPAPSGDVDVVALVWPDTGMLPLFGEKAIEQLNPVSWRLQRLDFDALSAEVSALAAGFNRVELRLEAMQPGDNWFWC